MNRGDVAFYGLLASVSIVAVAFGLWHHNHRPAATTGTKVATTTTERRTPSTRSAGRSTPRRSRTLRIRASRGPSWITIRARSSRGPVLYRGVLAQGRTVEEHGTTFWAEVGAVDNVDVRVDRRLVPLARSAL